jgi:hypothetical protein
MTAQNDAYQNLSRAVNHLFTAEGRYIWTFLLLAVLLAVMPLLVIQPTAPPLKVRIAKILLAAQPVAWVVAGVIVAAFINAGAAASEIAFWIFVGLAAVMAISGIAAMVMIRGWHRLTALALMVLNLWIIFHCALIGVIVILGAVL